MYTAILLSALLAPTDGTETAKALAEAIPIGGPASSSVDQDVPATAEPIQAPTPPSVPTRTVTSSAACMTCGGVSTYSYQYVETGSGVLVTHRYRARLFHRRFFHRRIRGGCSSCGG